MRPKFRTNLVCSQEEQQGVVFYRIDDPETHNSFRLYEIEYLIAQKLDGSRTPAEVIAAIKDEYNFDIGEGDLNKFIGQLASMSFVSDGKEGGRGGVLDIDALVEQAEPLPAPELVHPTPEDGDRTEFYRLLRAAFLHIKQGYVVHARDYILAARELDHTHEELDRLVAHMDSVGGNVGPAEVQYLWNQAKQLFPDLAEQVGPLLDHAADAGKEGEQSVDASAKKDAASSISESVQRSTHAWDQDLRIRVRLTAALVAIVVAGSGGLLWAMSFFGVFASAPQVYVKVLKSDSIPIYYETPASDVQPGSEKWLAFASAGVVKGKLPAVGVDVAEGDTIASLALPRKLDKAIANARQAVAKAVKQHEAAQRSLAETIGEREAIESHRAVVKERLKRLRPKSVLSRGGGAKREVKKNEQLLVKANRKLSKLAKKERKPRAKEAQTAAALASAEKKLDDILRSVANKVIQAPFAGKIAAIKIKTNDAVGAGKPAILLRDARSVRLRFALTTRVPALQVGGEARISIAGGKPAVGKIQSLRPEGRGQTVFVDLVDPAGGLVAMDPSSLRLVREMADPAFQVPVGSLVRDAAEKATFVLLAVDGRASRQEVDVLAQTAENAVVRFAAMQQARKRRSDVSLVWARAEPGESLSAIADATTLEIVDQ